MLGHPARHSRALYWKSDTKAGDTKADDMRADDTRAEETMAVLSEKGWT